MAIAKHHGRLIRDQLASDVHAARYRLSSRRIKVSDLVRVIVDTEQREGFEIDLRECHVGRHDAEVEMRAATRGRQVPKEQMVGRGRRRYRENGDLWCAGCFPNGSDSVTDEKVKIVRLTVEELVELHIGEVRAAVIVKALQEILDCGGIAASNDKTLARFGLIAKWGDIKGQVIPSGKEQPQEFEFCLSLFLAVTHRRVPPEVYPLRLRAGEHRLHRDRRLVVDDKDRVLRSVLFYRYHKVRCLRQGDAQILGQGGMGHRGLRNPSVIPFRELEVAETTGDSRPVRAADHHGLKVKLSYRFFELERQQVDRFSGRTDEFTDVTNHDGAFAA